MSHPERAYDPTGRFTERAHAYAAARPQYPPEAIDAVLEGLGQPSRVTVADVGAGTGIATRLLAERDVCVIAIEPNAAMRAQAVNAANVVWRDGTAEDTGLPAQNVDAVTVFQAFHWFSATLAMREFRRIARSRAALVQNERDERGVVGAEYGEIVRAYATDETEVLRLRAPEIFSTFPDATVTRFEFPSVQRLDLEGVLQRATSTSYLPQRGPAADAMRIDLRALFERRSRDGVLEIPLRVTVVRADW
jgi:SAM-dependent methyltransferase